MGGGNGQKSATARARKQKEMEAAKGKGSQLKSNQAAQNIKCNVCMQTFICTSTEAKLKEHCENKHPKNEFAQCFPDFQRA